MGACALSKEQFYLNPHANTCILVDMGPSRGEKARKNRSLFPVFGQGVACQGKSLDMGKVHLIRLGFKNDATGSGVENSSKGGKKRGYCRLLQPGEEGRLNKSTRRM